MCSDRDTIPVRSYTACVLYDISNVHPSTSTRQTLKTSRNGGTWSANDAFDVNSPTGPRQSRHQNINPQTLLGQAAYYPDQPFLWQTRLTKTLPFHTRAPPPEEDNPPNIQAPTITKSASRTDITPMRFGIVKPLLQEQDK